jgi:hypothetical protein
MKPAAPINPAFAQTYARLREVMLASAKGMIVDQDGPEGLVLHAPIPNPMHPKQPLWFGAVKIGKAYVSYHLMPIYMSAPLQARVSAALKPRMQGLSCFNFKAVDEALFADLAELTAAAAEAFSKPIEMPKRPGR